jgi:hypothetical protein
MAIKKPKPRAQWGLWQTSSKRTFYITIIDKLEIKGKMQFSDNALVNPKS